MTDRPAGPQGRFTCFSPSEGRFLDEALSDYCHLEDGELPLARREAQMLLLELRGFVSAPSVSAFNAPSGVLEPLSESFAEPSDVEPGVITEQEAGPEAEARSAAIDWSSVHADDVNYSKRPITRFDLLELIGVEGVIFFTPDPQRADRVIDVGEKLVFFMPFSGMTIQTERIDDIRGVAWETTEQHAIGVTR